ncbi:hypothetical protein PoB_005814100 [Plakobranchus ocellatus]|uniref:Uncharacterized protein n=1 Tax=Plakobranchus ocellatus TaxID=259542 RepID=A0AAV4CJF7_9GAST|nr:hypothetical protein PoB_005814100 [Plakobranchus ocellatus]
MDIQANTHKPTHTHTLVYQDKYKDKLSWRIHSGVSTQCPAFRYLDEAPIERSPPADYRGFPQERKLAGKQDGIERCSSSSSSAYRHGSPTGDFRL